MMEIYVGQTRCKFYDDKGVCAVLYKANVVDSPKKHLN